MYTEVCSYCKIHIVNAEFILRYVVNVWLRHTYDVIVSFFLLTSIVVSNRCLYLRRRNFPTPFLETFWSSGCISSVDSLIIPFSNFSNYLHHQFAHLVCIFMPTILFLLTILILFLKWVLKNFVHVIWNLVDYFGLYFYFSTNINVNSLKYKNFSYGHSRVNR